MVTVILFKKIQLEEVLNFDFSTSKIAKKAKLDHSLLFFFLLLGRGAGCLKSEFCKAEALSVLLAFPLTVTVLLRS